tara:strand:+ start:2400 stop:3695 length:1296 start_codon:yes stop_codon:yes gene_type:complete
MSIKQIIFKGEQEDLFYEGTLNSNNEKPGNYFITDEEVNIELPANFIEISKLLSLGSIASLGDIDFTDLSPELSNNNLLVYNNNKWVHTNDVSLIDITASNMLTTPESGLTLGSTVVTSTAAELNLLDGSVAGTVLNSKAVIYGANGEVNATKLQVAGADITSTVAELNKLDGATVTTAEINYLDITTLGTSEASKAITVDSYGDLIVPDSDKFQFGAGLDMTLYHDGTDSYITNKTGALKIATETSGIAVTIGHTTSEVTVADNLNVKGNVQIDNASSLQLSELDSNGSNYVAIKAPDSVSSNITLTLPDGIGSNGQVLSTNASGVLSWTTAAGVRTYSSKTATFTAAVNNHYSVSTAGGAIVANLPQISTTSEGESLVIKFKTGTNTLTIAPYSGNTIEGLNNLIMTDSQSPGQSITLVTDGTSAWEII